MDATQPSKTSPGGLPAQSDVGSSPSGSDDLTARLKELEQDLIEREHALDAAGRQLIRLRTRIEDLKSHIDYWKGACGELFESTSWKLTAPVRFLGKVWRRASQGRRGQQIHPTGSADSVSPSLFSRSFPEIEATLADQMIDRSEILEGAILEMLAGLKDNTGDGRYIHRVTDRVDADRLSVKAIAFYTLQYRVNRQGVGRNDTRRADWSDVNTALPRYVGHYQPHVPDEFDCCDQWVPDALQKQVALANQYGVYGFCFQFPQLKESPLFPDPLKRLLEDPTLDIRFCVCFGDDGALSIRKESETTASHDASPSSENDHALLDLVAPALADSRYIRIDGKPLLLVCRASGARVRGLRDRASAMGFPDLYLVAVQLDPKDSIVTEFDAVVEDPTCERPGQITAGSRFIDRDFRGHIFSYAQMMERYSLLAEPPHLTFKTVVTGYDNEPLRPGEGTSFAGANPTLYARWLDRCCRLAMKRRPEERLVFISSWNNWAEGGHLEPDRRFGYGYLHATANVLRSFHHDAATEKLIEEVNASFVRTSDVAVIFHCHYEDLVEPIFERYLAGANGVDLFVTVRLDVSADAITRMRERFRNVLFLRHENRGRDIRPFLLALRHVESLGYRFACKVHTKKSPQAEKGGGELWRQELLERLLGTSDSSALVVRLFNEEPGLGLLVPEGSVMDLLELRNHIDNTFWLDRLLSRLDKELIGNYDFSFPAGSMYWFRMEALAGLDSLVLPEDAFEQELGQRDGTLAHAMERLVPLYALRRGFHMKEIDVRGGGIPTANPVIGRTSARTLAPLP